MGKADAADTCYRRDGQAALEILWCDNATFYVLTHLSAVLFCLCGCAREIEVTFKVRVQDAQGNDLLDPEKDNSWIIGTLSGSEA